jgi:hypothetical protein
VRDLSLWISVVSELRVAPPPAAGRWLKLPSVLQAAGAVRQVGGQLLDGGLVLLALLLGSAELLKLINCDCATASTA